MELVDAHAHVFSIKNYEIPTDITPVVVGYSHGSNRKAVEFARGRYPFVLGIAPQTAIKEDIRNIDEWVDFIRKSRPNAIGEVGLDYKWPESREDIHKEQVVFERMIALADEMELPIVIHSRDNPNENGLPKNAIDDIIEALGMRRYMMHFFSGTAEQALRAVGNGAFISIIHLHSKQRKKVINAVDIDRMVVESDCPYVGRTPESVREAVQYISEIKGIDEEEVARITTKNAKEFFGFE